MIHPKISGGMMFELPLGVDLSDGTEPKKFFTPLIRDRFRVEEWRASPQAFNYEIPSSSGCGLKCLLMLLKLENRPAPRFHALFRQACRAGVYVRKSGHNGWIGARHHELAEFGLSACVRESLNTNDLARAVHGGHYVIPSVSSDIRYRLDLEPVKKTGHMVLLYRYDTDANGQRTFFVQNSAGFASINTQIGVEIPEPRLQQVFSGRAILVRSPYAL